MRMSSLTGWTLLALAWTMWSADLSWATSDTTFAGPLGTVTDIVSGTGGQLAAALAVGAALARCCVSTPRSWRGPWAWASRPEPARAS